MLGYHRNIANCKALRMLVAITLLLLSCHATMAHKSVRQAKHGCDALVVSCYSPFYRWGACVTREVEKAIDEQVGDGKVERLYLPMVAVRSKAEYDSLCVILHNRLERANPKMVVLVGSNSALFAHDVDSVKPGISMLGGRRRVYRHRKQRDTRRRVVASQPHRRHGIVQALQPHNTMYAHTA